MFNMSALVLIQGGPSDNNPATGSENGRYEYVQDPISGARTKVWVPEVAPDTSQAVPEGYMAGRRIICSARGILEGGIRVTSTTERYSTRGSVETVDYINLEFPAGEVLTRRDRITDIRDSNGNLVWIEEESTNRPTVFEVTGVTPVTDPFGQHLKNFTLLARADDQSSIWREIERKSSGG